MCKTENFVPLAVPGLSATSGSNSSSTSTLQDLSSTSPAEERSDDLVPGRSSGSLPKTQNQNKKRNGNRDSNDRLRTQKCLHPYTFPRYQIRNVLRKWYQNRGSIVFSHFPKDGNCEIHKRTKMTRAPCRRRTGEALPRAEKLGD